MKNTLIAAAALAALIGTPALAADMPLKAAPMAPAAPVWSWTGFYIGVNAGAAINDSNYSLFPTGCFLTGCGGSPAVNPLRSDSASFRQTAFTGGGQIGYNWQNGSMVWGIETDFNFKDENQSDNVNRLLAAPLVGNFVHSTSDKLDWFGTLRGRAGFLVTPTWLVYGTGGLAYGHVASTTSVAFTSTSDAYLGSVSTTRAGWTAGAGAEWRFSSNWSIKVEYLFVDLGTINYTDACFTAVCTTFVPPPSYQTTLRVRDNIVRAGINWQFGGGPVVAKY